MTYRIALFVVTFNLIFVRDVVQGSESESKLQGCEVSAISDLNHG